VRPRACHVCTAICMGRVRSDLAALYVGIFVKNCSMCVKTRGCCSPLMHPRCRGTKTNRAALGCAVDRGPALSDVIFGIIGNSINSGTGNGGRRPTSHVARVHVEDGARHGSERRVRSSASRIRAALALYRVELPRPSPPPRIVLSYAWVPPSPRETCALPSGVFSVFVYYLLTCRGPASALARGLQVSHTNKFLKL